MTLEQRYQAATLKTAARIKEIAASTDLRKVSSLSLPEIEAVSDLIAQIVPAGNVPAMILSNLARLPGRRVPPDVAQRDITLLFRGVEQMLDKAVYTAFFAGPAAILWAYQNILKLAGKSPEQAFPNGAWQFYVEYALREDTARHATETHGFHTALRQHNIRLTPTDQLAAWAMAAIHILHQYHALLANEWRERIYLHILHQVTARHPNHAHHTQLYRLWEQQRPYRRGPDARQETFAAYRQRIFDTFLLPHLARLPRALRRTWNKRVKEAEKNLLPAYQRQMSILAYLEPGEYRETRQPIDIVDAYIGIIHHGHYYLLRACAPHTTRPAEVFAVRNQIAAILAAERPPPEQGLSSLAACPRRERPALHKHFSPALLDNLHALRRAPILINTGPHSAQALLSDIRQAERGAGDHPLTLFLTPKSCVFDLSHIFFDGIWGTALAEILTNEALSWAVYLQTMPPPQPQNISPYSLSFSLQRAETIAIQRSTPAPNEVSAETTAVNLSAIRKVRRIFKQRSDLLHLTVNDLLLLYRGIYSRTYTLNPRLEAELHQLARIPETKTAALAALAAIAASRNTNPAILIPIDASRQQPKERIYPMTFEVPLDELNLTELHTQTLRALHEYKAADHNRALYFANFDRLQRTYLAALAGLSAVLRRAKEIASQGESHSMGALKLLAHLPAPIQNLLDKIPNRFDVLNDIIKGREVFSNVGAVARKSTLTRFISAKDDNDKKTLVWGVITDSNHTLHLSLRDFRPHVGQLIAAGHKDLARRMTTDYLESYARGLNQYISELYLIASASRETIPRHNRSTHHAPLH